jgi:hypothetical protein
MDLIQSLKDNVTDVVNMAGKANKGNLSEEKRDSLAREIDFMREQIRRSVETNVFTNFSQAVQSDDVKIPDVNLHFKDVAMRGSKEQPEIYVRAPVVHVEMSTEDLIARIKELDAQNNVTPDGFIPMEKDEEDTVVYDDDTGLFITNLLFKVNPSLYTVAEADDATQEGTEETGEPVVSEIPPETPSETDEEKSAREAKEAAETEKLKAESARIAEEQKNAEAAAKAAEDQANKSGKKVKRI